MTQRSGPGTRGLHRRVAGAVWLAGAIVAFGAGVGAYEEPRAPRDSVAAPRAPATPAVVSADTVLRKPVAWGLVRIARNERIHRDEVVHGDVLLIGGGLRVDGVIEGGAIVIAGNIDVGPSGRITGEAVAVGGRVQETPGAQVRGALSLTRLSTPSFYRFTGPRARQQSEIVGDLLKLVALVLLGALAQRFAARRLASAHAALEAATLRCLGLGMFVFPAVAFSAIVLSFLLAVTVLGLPVAVALLASTVVVCATGFLVGACWLGARTAAVLRRPAADGFRCLLAGLIVLRLPELTADLLRLASPQSDLAGRLEIVSAVLEGLLLVAGLGAITFRFWMLGAQSGAGPRFAPGPAVR